MKDVNWWLMALAALAGLAVTFALTVRKVTREIPVTRTISAAVRSAGTAVGASSTMHKLTGGDVELEPYGTGSIRTAASADAPSSQAGFTIKGNEDSMLYHTTESPWYKQTIAEVWFADEASAVAAGFARWDSGKKAKAGAQAATLLSVDDVAPGPYGKGSAKPNADGSGPAGWTIKGNSDSMLYHPTDSPAYSETIAEVWFFDEATAKAAGFDKWDKNFR
ncbi:MAG: hypothetical protein NTY24_11885 [Mycobacterium sp.]|jgi:hypothetical protein|nr:hypothetical protein [Mycobacterium sp.]MCX6481051.1 hypothetical protein [Mycobacterium sp.]